MFKGIFSTLNAQSLGPKSSALISTVQTSQLTAANQAMNSQIPAGMIAEPAQVMVLVPGTRAQQAETKLASFKFYAYVIAFALLAVGLSVVYFFFWRRPVYEGRELPGAVKSIRSKTKSVIETSVKPEAKEEYPDKFTLKQEKPYLKDLQEDIVPVIGPLPTWSSEDTVELETKVSENHTSVNTLIKSRESLTKHFEELAQQIKSPV